MSITIAIIVIYISAFRFNNRYNAFLRGELFRQRVINKIPSYAAYGTEEYYDLILAAYKPSIDVLERTALRNRESLWKAFPERLHFITINVHPL